MTRSSTRDATSSELEPRDEAYRDWIFTLPNVICMIRMVGSLAIVALAVAGFRYWFVGLFLALTISDWIDGWLARQMHQRSDFGARLDSFADFFLYAALVLGCIVLCYEVIADEWFWIFIAIGSYAVSSAAGLLKYGKLPSYHTWAAKKSQFLVLIGGIALVLGLSVWPMRLATIAVCLTNLEATLLTWVLPTWQADVPSLRSVLRNKEKYGVQPDQCQ